MADATKTEKSPVLALLLGWAVPGAGHAYGGQWGKAVLFAVLILGLFTAGVILGSGTNVLRGELWIAAQICAGAPTLIMMPVSGHLAETHGVDWAAPRREMGTLYTAVAGFLNLLVMLDAYVRLAYPHGLHGDDEEEAA